MNTEQNGFSDEQNRLDFTKRYIQAVIQTAETSKDQFRQNIQAAFMDADWQEGGLYSELLASAHFFDLSETELKSLQAARQKPYFARVDFLRDGTEKNERLYFGKTSLYQRENQEQLIVDWRAPIANLYYEGRLGPFTYEAEGESLSGNIVLKRQLTIEEGTLKEIRDIDITANDALLQESLAKSSSSRLTDIVTTIQEEQNRIIRADLHRPIIVQGAAGSGKTTIALHRVSYFLYTYRELFDARDLLILAPSRLFLHYISDALPELGVEKAKQFTFAEYVEFAIGRRLSLIPDRKLPRLLEKVPEAEDKARLSGLKGSPLFKSILDEYLADFYKSFRPADDFRCDKFRLYSARRFSRLMEEEYWYLPFYSRLDKMKEILRGQIKTNKKEMISRIEDFYDRRIDKALYRKLEPGVRKDLVSKLLDRKKERTEEFNKEVRRAVGDYFKQFKKEPLLDTYARLFTDPSKLAGYSSGMLAEEDAAALCRSFQAQRGKYELEDLGPLLYMYARLFGVPKERRAKNIVIDEAQDYSFMSLLSLKTACDTDMFTLVGDLAQGIHSYRGITSWDSVRKEIFPRAAYTELKKSYRTTVEIMEQANRLLKRLTVPFTPAEPVVRHGKTPSFREITNEDWAEKLIADAASLSEEGMNTIAVITKTMKEAKEACQSLHALNVEADLIGENSGMSPGRLAVLPSYAAKGLEFDAVFALSLGEIYRPDSDMDIKLLYVVMTRPLHRLAFYGRAQEDFLLGEV